MRYIIFGGAGFIGTNLALYLKDKVEKVTVFDDFSYASSDNVNILSNNKINIENKSVFNHLDVIKSVKEHDIVINAITSEIIDDGFYNAEPLTVTNMLSTQIIMQSVTHCELLNKIILLSDLHVYGKHKKYRERFKEDDLTDPVYPIGGIKRGMEIMAETWMKTVNVNTIVLRLGTIYGEHMNYNRLNDPFLKMSMGILNKSCIPIYTDGKCTRDYTYVKDICDYIYRISEDDELNGFNIFNVNSMKEITHLDVFEKVCKTIGKEDQLSKYLLEQTLHPIVFHVLADNSKLVERYGNHFSEYENAMQSTLEDLSAWHSKQFS